MEKDLKSALKACPLFTGCDPEEAWQELTAAGVYRENYSPKDTVSSRRDNKGRVGICISGRAAVYSLGHETALLNRLLPGSLFGVATLYADESADTQIIAETETEFLFLDRTGIDTLLDHKKIRRNLIGFLSGRIRFLTEKISSFTAPCAEGKLARYLIQNADESGLVSTFRSYAELARILNLGRASLYRAMQYMEEEGIIRKDEKKIYITSKEKLEKMQK